MGEGGGGEVLWGGAEVRESTLGRRGNGVEGFMFLQRHQRKR